MYNNFDPIAFNESLAIDESEYTGETLAPFFYVSHSFRWLKNRTRTYTVTMTVFTEKGLFEYLFYSTDSIFNFNCHIRLIVQQDPGYLPLPQFVAEQIDRRACILSLMD